MNPVPSLQNRSAQRQVPTRLFIVVVFVVCIVLVCSAVLTFTILMRLRIQYLSNRGHEIAVAIEAQARGQGRRNSPTFWQSLFDESFQTYSDDVVFLALTDESDRVIAGKGKPSLGPLELAVRGTDGTYVYDLPLASPRVQHGGMRPQISGWQLRIGINAADAGFIRRQAVFQFAVSGAAILALIALTVYLSRTLSRFLELKAREDAEAHLKSLGTMAASLAHEIRNPLSAMKGLTQLAQEDLPPDDGAQARLRTVVSEAERLERLVSDLLDFARRKEPVIGEFNLTELVAHTKAMLRSRLESSGVTLLSSVTPNLLKIKSDAGGLKQVLLNVLINAVDATPRGGTVVLKAERDESDNLLVIQIDDAGQGLGARNPEELFQPFVTTKARGTGLGLAISRGIVESLGGSLTLGNIPHGGARCSIHLPLPSLLRPDAEGAPIRRAAKEQKAGL